MSKIEQEVLIKKAESLIKKIEGATFTSRRRDVLILYDEIATEVQELKEFLWTLKPHHK